ncbi:hypothetical protein LIER_41101 [Lithospermum erythrorhizon]|uniref:FLZ-type domain-containing protein n=1 Tax=Lithospermum erythrorhizon TaxID=34254 RepID=A0AAV3R7G0_LITER
MTRSSSLYYTGCEENYEPHFLDTCSLCQRAISNNSDIFMYRGNTPFCSQECRQEQIEMDEADEKRWKHSSKRSNNIKSSESTKDSDTKKAVRTGSIAVA